MNAPFRSYTGVERAAVLMMLVGEEEAAAILQKLDPEEVRQLGKAMFAVADVGEDQVGDVLDDFVGRARDRTAIGFDPKPIIEGVMTRALGQEKADSVLARITPPEAACQIDLLDWMDAGEIAAMIEKEHPQIAAVVIANLDPVDRGAGARNAARCGAARHPPPRRAARADHARGGRDAAHDARRPHQRRDAIGRRHARRHARGGEDPVGRAQDHRTARHAQVVQDRPRSRQGDRGSVVRVRESARHGRQEPRHADPQHRQRRADARAEGRRRGHPQPLPRLHVGARRRRHPRRDGSARPDEAVRSARSAEDRSSSKRARSPRTARS